MNLLLQLLANGIVNGVLFAMLAFGFGLVYRSARVFHIAYAGIFLIATYAFYAANTLLRLPLWLSLPMGVFVCGAMSWAMELWLYRPLFQMKASAGAVMVASMGAFIIIENVLTLVFGNEVRSLNREIAFRIQLGAIVLTSIQLLQFGIGALLLALLAIAIKKQKAFKIIWAMGDEPDLIPVLGISINKYRSMVFVLSAVMGGTAACLIGLDVGVDPNMGMTYLLIAAVAVLSGGIDRYIGWVAGGFILALFGSIVVWKVSAEWIDLTIFGFLLMVMLLRPQGLFGLKKRLEEKAD